MYAIRSYYETVATRMIGQRAQQLVVADDLDFGVAEFAMMPALDQSPELHRHRLHAVADAEHRHAEFEHGLRGARRVVEIDGLGPARKHDAARTERPNLSYNFV